MLTSPRKRKVLRQARLCSSTRSSNNSQIQVSKQHQPWSWSGWMRACGASGRVRATVRGQGRCAIGTSGFTPPLLQCTERFAALMFALHLLADAAPPSFAAAVAKSKIAASHGRGSW